jgi:hypothetical protein
MHLSNYTSEFMADDCRMPWKREYLAMWLIAGSSRISMECILPGHVPILQDPSHRYRTTLGLFSLGHTPEVLTPSDPIVYFDFHTIGWLSQRTFSIVVDL